MKAIAGIILLAVVALFPVVAEPDRAWGAGPAWVLVDENRASSFSYDKAGITRPQEGITRVMTRTVYTPEGKKEVLDLLKPAKGYENLFESRYLIELDCAKRKHRPLRVTHLDKAGTLLKEFDLTELANWEDIPPDARIEVIADSECASRP